MPKKIKIPPKNDISPIFYCNIQKIELKENLVAKVFGYFFK